MTEKVVNFTPMSFRLKYSVMEKSHQFLYGLDLSASVEVTENYAQDDLLILSLTLARDASACSLCRRFAPYVEKSIKYYRQNDLQNK